VVLVVVAARFRWEAVASVLAAGVLGGWVFAANSFVLDGWWLRLSAVPVVGVVAVVATQAARVRCVERGGRAVGALGAGFVTFVATLWWRPCVGRELGTILTAAQSGTTGQLLPMAAYIIGALSPVVGLALAHRAWEPAAQVTTRLGWVAVAMTTVIGCSILAGQHDEVVVALTRWTSP
jgi:hypothetical protein